MEYWMSSFSSKFRGKNKHAEVIVDMETYDGLCFNMFFPNFHYFRDYIKMNKGLFDMDLWKVRYENKKKCYRVEIVAKRKE